MARTGGCNLKMLESAKQNDMELHYESNSILLATADFYYMFVSHFELWRFSLLKMANPIKWISA